MRRIHAATLLQYAPFQAKKAEAMRTLQGPLFKRAQVICKRSYVRGHMDMWEGAQVPRARDARTARNVCDARNARNACGVVM